MSIMPGGMVPGDYSNAPTDTNERTYGVTIKGERHTFQVAAWDALTFNNLCTVLSDVTGWRADHLKRTLPERFDRLGYAHVRPANSHERDVPVFLIRSSDGGKPVS